MAFRPKPDDKSGAKTTPSPRGRTDFSSPPRKLCDYEWAKRELPRIRDAPRMEREEKLPSALGRQVGRQADIELYISIS